MSDKYGEGQDRYCYPGSAVLINLLGITDSELLNQAEVEFTRLRLSLRVGRRTADFGYKQGQHTFCHQ